MSTSLFQEYQLKDVTLRNRIAVAPMCQYSSENGFPNDWHYVHLGSRAVGGAGLVMVEATAVSADGRISPGDSGIYLDAHVPEFARIAKFLKQYGAVPAIQIAHAGRKASANKPWEGDDHIPDDQGGWELIAPSAVAFGGALSKVPRAMKLDDIERVQNDFVTAAQRSLAAGFELLELHFAHGYLAHEFYSPITNHRTDQYGGSFENRIRFMMETLNAVRQVWPERLPLIARLSVTDWSEQGVTVEESIELIGRMKRAGLDMVDVSQGFVNPDISKVPWGPNFMVPIAGRIKKETGIQVAVGWMITDPIQANEAIRTGDADVVMLARELLRDPYWPYHAAIKLNDEKAHDLLPVQYARAIKAR